MRRHQKPLQRHKRRLRRHPMQIDRPHRRHLPPTKLPPSRIIQPRRLQPRHHRRLRQPPNRRRSHPRHHPRRSHRRRSRHLHHHRPHPPSQRPHLPHVRRPLLPIMLTKTSNPRRHAPTYPANPTRAPELSTARNITHNGAASDRRPRPRHKARQARPSFLKKRSKKLLRALPRACDTSGLAANRQTEVGRLRTGCYGAPGREKQTPAAVCQPAAFDPLQTQCSAVDSDEVVSDRDHTCR